MRLIASFIMSGCIFFLSLSLFFFFFLTTDKNITKTVSQQHMMKEFTLPRLRLLGPASNGLVLFIMLKSVNTSVYNAQTTLKPAPMVLECSKIQV